MRHLLVSARNFSLLATFAAALSAFAAPPTDFTVESPLDGSKFRLADAKGKYVALHFLLKTECPFCLRHTRDYAKKAASQPGLVQVFLKPDSAEEIKQWAADLGEEAATKQVGIYRDPDAALAKAFGIPDGYQFHGQTVHFPALVLLDPAGHEVFRYLGKNNTDRFSFEKLTAKVAELKSAAGTPAAPAPTAK
jgi:peroxiredoxin Q/BCP